MTVTLHRMRTPCKHCGTTEGYIETKNGQDCVYCKCGRYAGYNAPKTETGREPRSVTKVRNGIKPGQRVRILERDGGKCFLCGCTNNLHAGHLLSYAEGLKQGLTDAELNDDENLAAMCDECNLGLSDRPVPIRLLVAVLVARLKLVSK